MILPIYQLESHDARVLSRAAMMPANKTTVDVKLAAMTLEATAWNDATIGMLKRVSCSECTARSTGNIRRPAAGRVSGAVYSPDLGRFCGLETRRTST